MPPSRRTADPFDSGVAKSGNASAQDDNPEKVSDGKYPDGGLPAAWRRK
jgi:hypothetical protein